MRLIDQMTTYYAVLGQALLVTAVRWGLEALVERQRGPSWPPLDVKGVLYTFAGTTLGVLVLGRLARRMTDNAHAAVLAVIFGAVVVGPLIARLFALFFG